MSLFICSLNSGSNGNCYYIGNHRDAVLIDAGLSCRETEKRMKRAQLSIEKVRAIFITHEHADHVFGVNTLSKKYNLPVFITHSTLHNARLKVQHHLVASFKANKPVEVGTLSVTAFPKFHDACDPHSFVVEGNRVRVGVFTDIGKLCKNVIQHFEQCHAAFLEANYDEEMLINGSYPRHLKSRISSDVGHLSNVQALELFTRHKPPYMSHLLLSHLSANNNSPEVVEDLFRRNTGKTKVMIAPRVKESPVFHVTGSGVQSSALPKVQLSLFGAEL